MKTSTASSVDANTTNNEQLLDTFKDILTSQSQDSSPEDLLKGQRDNLDSELSTLYQIENSSTFCRLGKLCHYDEYFEAYYPVKKDRPKSLAIHLMVAFGIPKSTAYSEVRVAQMLVREEMESLLDSPKGDRNFKLRKISSAPRGSQSKLLAEIDSFDRDTLGEVIKQARVDAAEVAKIAKAEKDAAKVAKAAEEAAKVAEVTGSTDNADANPVSDSSKEDKVA
jgi:hypothetical protein